MIVDFCFWIHTQTQLQHANMLGAKICVQIMNVEMTVTVTGMNIIPTTETSKTVETMGNARYQNWVVP